MVGGQPVGSVPGTRQLEHRSGARPGRWHLASPRGLVVRGPAPQLLEQGVDRPGASWRRNRLHSGTGIPTGAFTVSWPTDGSVDLGLYTPRDTPFSNGPECREESSWWRRVNCLPAPTSFPSKARMDTGPTHGWWCCPETHWKRRSRPSSRTHLQGPWPQAIDAAVDVVVALHQPDALHLGAGLHGFAPFTGRSRSPPHHHRPAARCRWRPSPPDRWPRRPLRRGSTRSRIRRTSGSCRRVGDGGAALGAGGRVGHGEL